MEEEKYVKKILNFWVAEIKENGLPEKKTEEMWWKRNR